MGLYDIRFEGLSKTSSDFLKSVLNVFSGKYYGLRNPIWRFGGLYYMSVLSESRPHPPQSGRGITKY
jgi:hypothetical protein